MKRFAILGFALVWVFSAQAQDCSKSRSSCSSRTYSSCSSNNQTRTVVHSYSSDHDQDRKRRYDRMVFMWGAGAHFLPNRSTFAINGRTGPVQTKARQRHWQTDALLGIRYGLNGSHRRANVIGAFGDFGMLATPALERIFSEQGLYNEVQFGSQADFRSLEAGFLFREWLRVSGGVGKQYFFDNAGNQNRVNYYTATTGVYIPLGRRLVWTTTATAMFGQDFQKVTIRPATGLAFRFNFMRM